MASGPGLAAVEPPLARTRADVRGFLCPDGSLARQELLRFPDLSHAVRGWRSGDRALAGQSARLDARPRGGGHFGGDVAHGSDVHLDAFARTPAGVPERHRLQAGESRSPPRIAANATDRRSVRLA